MRWPLLVRWPGTCSSMTMWKLVPPKPNALTPATRVRPGATSQSRSSVLTANGDAAQSTLGFGRSKLRLGGSTLSCSARAVLRMPAAPAALLRWPMLDLTDPSATDPGRNCAPANASTRLPTSTTSPTRVDVPWPSISVHSSGESPALCQRALDGQALADRVGRRDALALAVARAADAAHDGVDAVAVALGVGEALEHEQARALAHDEAVGAVRVRARTGRRQRADGAELDEARGAHVAIDAAGDRHVELAVGEALDRRVHRRHRRRARGVDGEVRSVEVEEVGDAPGGAVAQLAGHRVLADAGQRRLQVGMQLALDRGPHVARAARRSSPPARARARALGRRCAGR